MPIPMSTSNPTAPQPRQFVLPTKGEAIEFRGRTYFVGEPIASGAFGNVVECWDEWANPLVAKVLRPEGKSYDEVRSSWNDEVAKLVHLRHPSITYIHDAFEFRDTFYLVMERGMDDLHHVIHLQDMKPDFWIPHVARDVLQGLSFLHVNGFVHKDIHPGNVFVFRSFDRMVPSKEPVWSFKIGDLGITRLASEIDVFNTMLADWMRPPESINPNQYGPIGFATDIYHAGLLLLSFLLNRTPTFTTAEVLDAVPRKLAEQHSSPYGPIIARALRRHVHHRTPSAIQFWRELSAVQPRM